MGPSTVQCRIGSHPGNDNVLNRSIFESVIVPRESIDHLSALGDHLALEESPVDRQRRIVIIASRYGRYDRFSIQFPIRSVDRPQSAVNDSRMDQSAVGGDRIFFNYFFIGNQMLILLQPHRE
jgi:hypothetical protein